MIRRPPRAAATPGGMPSADQAMDILRAGNARFAGGHASRSKVLSRQARSQLAWGQSPMAIILGCSDSRVPAELVFDQGLADLFVIRVAATS